MGWRNVALIGVGGALGTLLRYALEVGLGTSASFPQGIFVANLVGAFVIGAFFALLPRFASGAQPAIRMAVATGFIGGLTTLSSLALALALQVTRFGAATALLYGASTVGGGLLLAFAGNAGARILVKRVFRAD